MKNKLILFCTLCLLGACQSTAMSMVPALIINPSPEVKAELQQVLEQATGTPQIPLLETALTTSHKLLLERQALRDGQGRLLNGRHREPPLVFELYISAEKCWLKQAGSERQFVLTLAKCRPASVSGQQ